MDEKDNFLIRLFKSAYAPVLRLAFSFRWLLLCAAILLFAGSVFVFSKLGSEFVPQLDEGSIALKW